MNKYVLYFLFLGLGLVTPFISEAAPTTVRIYPTDDGITQLYDEDNKTTWSSARNFTGTIYRTPVTDADVSVHRADKQSGFYRIYRTSTVFDTSIIPDDANIESVSMFAYKSSGGNNNGQDLVLTAHTRASTTDLVKGDWNISNYGAEFARAGLLTGQYTEFEFNQTGSEYINLEDYTIIGGMQENDFDDIDLGTTQSGVTFYSADASGTSTDPYLEVTYFN